MEKTITGEKREVLMKEMKKPIKRSAEAKKRRQAQAKQRKKNSQLRKTLAAASFREQVGAGETDPPMSGVSNPPQSQPSQSRGSEGGKEKRIQSQCPKGNGMSSPHPPSLKKKDGSNREKENQHPKGHGEPSHCPSQTKKGAQPKPPRGKESTNKHRSARPPGSPHHVFLRLVGVDQATEEHRRDLMEDLAIRIAARPSSSKAKPDFVTDSRVEPDGSIRLSGPDQETADNIRGLLSARGDVTLLEGPGRLRRFSFRGPGYLNKMKLELVQRFFENQNPLLPIGSIRVISVDLGGTNPLFFADVTEEGYAYLIGRNLALDSMTTKVFFRHVSGKKEKSSIK